VTSSYGRIVTGGAVREAVRATIRTWLPTYTAEVERQTGRALPTVRSYGSGLPVEFPDGYLPGIVIVAPGLVSEPTRTGAGRFDAVWAVGVSVVVACPDREAAYTQAEDFTAALRALMVQQGSLGGLADGLDWISEEVSEVAGTTERSIHAGLLEFAVNVPGVMDAFAGFTTPLSPDATDESQVVEITAANVNTVRGP
jgi:hypothetical protein